MERLFIRMENYEAEAHLIRDRLLPGGYLLTSYETFILDSYEKDRLTSVGMFLERFSMPVARGLNEVRMVFEESENPQIVRSTVMELGEALLDARNDLSEDSEDMEIFPKAVGIHTWLEFTPHLIARIHNKDRSDNPLRFDQILALEPEYAALRQRLETSRTRDMPLMEYIHRETVAGFEGY
jgi:hypothetical protein